MTDNSCECCNAEPSVGVAAVPGIPMSIAWGRKCLEAGVIPYDLLVLNTALCGGWQFTADWWNELVAVTTAYFDKSMGEFRRSVDEEVLRQIEEEAAYYDAHKNDPPVQSAAYDWDDWGNDVV